MKSPTVYINGIPVGAVFTARGGVGFVWCVIHGESSKRTFATREEARADLIAYLD